MITLQIPPNITPAQIEIPATVKERSCKGALHVKPGSKKVTEAEWAHLKKAAPELVAKIQATKAVEGKAPGKAALKKAAALKNAKPKKAEPKKAEPEKASAKKVEGKAPAKVDAKKK